MASMVGYGAEGMLSGMTRDNYTVKTCKRKALKSGCELSPKHNR